MVYEYLMCNCNSGKHLGIIEWMMACPVWLWMFHLVIFAGVLAALIYFLVNSSCKFKL
jgi:hypothetical protein